MKSGRFAHFVSLVSFVAHHGPEEEVSRAWELETALPSWERHPSRRGEPRSGRESLFWIGGFPPV